MNVSLQKCNGVRHDVLLVRTITEHCAAKATVFRAYVIPDTVRVHGERRRHTSQKVEQLVAKNGVALTAIVDDHLRNLSQVVAACREDLPRRRIGQHRWIESDFTLPIADPL